MLPLSSLFVRSEWGESCKFRSRCCVIGRAGCSVWCVCACTFRPKSVNPNRFLKSEPLFGKRWTPSCLPCPADIAFALPETSILTCCRNPPLLAAHILRKAKGVHLRKIRGCFSNCYAVTSCMSSILGVTRAPSLTRQAQPLVLTTFWSRHCRRRVTVPLCNRKFILPLGVRVLATCLFLGK